MSEQDDPYLARYRRIPVRNPANDHLTEAQIAHRNMERDAAHGLRPARAVAENPYKTAPTGPDGRPVTDRRTVACRGCSGWAYTGDGDGHPYGWYSISVAVPAELGKHGAPYVWIGLWCSAACLASSAEQLAYDEELAHLAYDPDPPELDEPRPWTVSDTPQT